MNERMPFYSPELDRKTLESTAQVAQELLFLLNSEGLRNEINIGNVTLAMIRPNVGPSANNLALSDAEAADRIESMIEGLGVLAKFSFVFTKDAVEEFYGGDPKTNMSKGVAQNENAYPNRWLEFVDFMSSGPTTALLLHSFDGNAIPLWRSHLGHWNIDEVRDLSTIRGKLGVDKYNNLVHGSDAPEAVHKELKIIQTCIETPSTTVGN